MSIYRPLRMIYLVAFPHVTLRTLRRSIYALALVARTLHFYHVGVILHRDLHIRCT